jgi:2-deoxy-D-gluconate 3-dehydrogenase
VTPGYVATGFTAPLRADEARAQAITSRIPLGRWADPQEISGAVVFLASPLASYVTGQTIVVDGGFSIDG